MIIAPLPPLPDSVRPMIETDRDKPDDRARRDAKRPPASDAPDEERHEAANPIPNDRGQITGKLIDIVA